MGGGVTSSPASDCEKVVSFFFAQISIARRAKGSRGGREGNTMMNYRNRIV